MTVALILPTLIGRGYKFTAPEHLACCKDRPAFLRSIRPRATRHAQRFRGWKPDESALSARPVRRKSRCDRRRPRLRGSIESVFGRLSFALVSEFQPAPWPCR